MHTTVPAETFMKVREPVVLTPTFPRFLSGGDRIQFPVSVFNGTGRDGEFRVELQASGNVRLLQPPLTANEQAETHRVQREIQIEDDSEAQLIFELVARDVIGKTSFTLTASGNNEKTQMSVPIASSFGCTAGNADRPWRSERREPRGPHFPFQFDSSVIRIYTHCFSVSGD